jgi:hypothetical protein
MLITFPFVVVMKPGSFLKTTRKLPEMRAVFRRGCRQCQQIALELPPGAFKNQPSAGACGGIGEVFSGFCDHGKGAG